VFAKFTELQTVRQVHLWALSRASGRPRGSYGAARPRGRQKIPSAVVRLWVAGRRSGQAVVARGIGLFPLAAAATA
jgi:hypothetical protein